MMVNWIRSSLAWPALVVALTGCALPGLNPSVEGAESTATYQPPGRESGTVLNFSPIIERITPKLILEQRRNQSELFEKIRRQLAGDKSPSAVTPYRIGVGDVLAVIVYGHPDITNPAGTTQSVESSGRLVDAEGQIYVPFVGEIAVEGDTIDQVRKEITAGLSSVIRDPQVDVKVLNYRSKKVYITGDISKPCVIPIQDIPLTVVDALDACQSLLSERDPLVSGVNAIELIRGNQRKQLNLSQRYRRGGEPILLQAGDQLIVNDSFNRVFLVGEFAQQTAAPFSAGGMSLSDAMLAAGGLSLGTADAGSVYVIRGFVEPDVNAESGVQISKRPRVYHLDSDSMQAFFLADQFQLRPRDVVYAAPASLVNFNRALAQITPSLNVLFQSLLIYDRARD